MRRGINCTVTIVISLLFVLLGVFVFSSSYLRFGESCMEFGLSVSFYFCEIFSIAHSITPSVNTPSQVVTDQINLPSEWSVFQAKANEYFSLLFNGQNFMDWLEAVANTISSLSKIVVIILPFVIAVWFLIKWLYGRSNTRHNHDTVPLAVFKFVSKYTYQPLKRL